MHLVMLTQPYLTGQVLYGCVELFLLCFCSLRGRGGGGVMGGNGEESRDGWGGVKGGMREGIEQSTHH